MADKIPFLEGAPGWGKSALFKRIARFLDLRLFVEYLSRRAGNEIHGIPVVSSVPLKLAGKEHVVVEQAPPSWAIQACRVAEDSAQGIGGPGALVFFDELNQLSPSDMGQVMAILTERSVGNVDLPRESIALAAAGNPENLSAGGWKIPLPARRRIVKLDMKVDIGNFSSPGGFSSNWASFDEKLSEALVLGKPGQIDLADIPDAAALPPIIKFGRVLNQADRRRNRAFLAAYAKANPDVFNLPPDTAKMHDGWPSPAVFEDAEVLMTSVNQYVAENKALVRQMLLTAIMGPGAAGAILTAYDNISVPAADAVLDDVDVLRGNELAEDQTYYFSFSVVEEQGFRTRSIVKNSTASLKRAQNSWYNAMEVATILQRRNVARDIVCMMVGNLQQPGYRPKGTKAPPIVDELAPSLGAMKVAGVSWSELTEVS
jgi:hypothetical protein